MDDNSQNRTNFFPSSWTSGHLGNLAEVVTGNTPSTKDKENYGGQIPFVKPPQLQNCLVSSSEDYLTEQGCESARVLPSGSVLVSCIGNLGRTAINTIPIAFNQQINAIKPGSVFLPKFLFYQAQSLFFSEQLNALASATTVAIVNKGKFETISVRVAPKGEQERIVEKIEELFSDLDKSVESLKTAQEQLKIYRQSLLKCAFEGKLTETWRKRNIADVGAVDKLFCDLENETAPYSPKKRSRRLKELAPINRVDTFPIPETWKFKQLGFLAEIIGGITKGKKYGEQKTVQLPYLRVANVQDGFLDLGHIKTIEALPEDLEKYRLLSGDILYTEGGDRDKLGRGTIWKCEIYDCVHQNHIFRARLLTNEIQTKYVAYYSQTRSAKDYFFKYGKQTTNLASINLTVLSNFPVPIPPPEEQVEIVNLLESNLSWCDSLSVDLENSLNQAAILRQSILKQAFSGKLVPQDPKEEPASVLLERLKAELHGANGNGASRKIKKGRKKK